MSVPSRNRPSPERETRSCASFPRDLKVDLHVHTRHSRLTRMQFLGARDSYSRPEDVYRRAKARGMDLVTFTDHDTIDGCRELLSLRGNLPDFFISEEVSVRDARTGCRFHASVYDIDERQHAEIQRLRGEVRELLAYLRRESIPAALNHVGSSLRRGRPDMEELLEIAGGFPLVETWNGAEPAASNRLAADLAEALEAAGRRVGRTGGSDAHTGRRVGRTWTVAEAADRESFLAALRAGAVRPGGERSRFSPLLADVHEVVFRYYLDVATNRYGHLAGRARVTAALCAAASLPLLLVALPATGTVYRTLRAGGNAARAARALARRRAGEAPAAETGRLEMGTGALLAPDAEVG